MPPNQSNGHAPLWRSQIGLAAALVAISLVISCFKPQFLTYQNWITVVRQISINGLLAVGATFVLITGGVDLSLGSVVALAGVIAALFAHPGDFPLVIPVFMGVLAGLACGAVNGFLVTRGRVAPFIATLGTMTVARGLALVISGGKPISNLSRSFTYLGSGDLAGCPIPVLALLVMAILANFVLQHLRMGRYLYAVGGNERAAYSSGVRVTTVKLFAYSLCGAMAGLTGVVLAARITTGQPNAGLAYELDAIAAVVIGGTSLSGGVGSIGGTLLGALLMGVINNGLDLLNVQSYYQQIVKGIIIVGAVWWDQRGRRD